MAIIYCSASGSDSNDGTIGTPKLTPRAAQIAAGTGGKVLLKTGECFAPSSNGLFFFINGNSGIEIGTYGTASDKPILDALTYQNPAVGGWTYLNSGVWKKVFGAFWVRRLWVGSTNSGYLVNQRTIGTAKRRSTGSGMTGQTPNPSEASIIASLNSTNIWFGGGATTSYALYVYTGSSTVDPPTYYSGLAFIQSDAVSVGAVEGLMIQGQSGIYCHDVHFRGNGSVGIRLNTKNTATGDCYDNLIEDCTVTHCYNGAFLSRIDPQTSPLYRCKSSTVRRVYCDYASSADEMEPDTTYSFLTAFSDLFSVSDGSIAITVENCTAINSAHNGISVGSTGMATTPPTAIRIIGNTVQYDSWHTYARGISTFDADVLVSGNTFDGQNTRSQIQGNARIIGNVWKNLRNCVRKSGVAQAIASEAYIFSSGVSAVGEDQYIAINPTNVLIANNTFYMAPDVNDGAIEFHFFQNLTGSVKQPSFNAGSVTVKNNIVYGHRGPFVKTTEDPTLTIGQQTIQNNCSWNGLIGDQKIQWRGSNYTINAAPGCSGNIEDHPQLDTDYRPGNSKLKRTGLAINGFAYHGKRLYPIPNIGAVDDTTATPRGAFLA